jgi:hypothetical protein
LLKWTSFLVEGARVIWVTVPDDRAAYIVFETMSDRGLELSATDLIKNHVLSKAGSAHFEQIRDQMDDDGKNA